MKNVVTCVSAGRTVALLGSFSVKKGKDSITATLEGKDGKKQEITADRMISRRLVK